MGEASDGNEALEKARALKPDLGLMDLWMPNCDGVEATRRLQAEMPEVNVLVLTISERDADIFGAIKVGARGYLLKDEDPEQIAKAFHRVVRGETIVYPGIATKLLNEFKIQAPEAANEDDSSLSQREQQALRLVAQGASNKEIAGSLSISENMVKAYLRQILEKLNVVNCS
ncbi:response regulator [Chloroflexota bacterium]